MSYSVQKIVARHQRHVLVLSDIARSRRENNKIVKLRSSMSDREIARVICID